MGTATHFCAECGGDIRSDGSCLHATWRERALEKARLFREPWTPAEKRLIDLSVEAVAARYVEDGDLTRLEADLEVAFRNPFTFAYAGLVPGSSRVPYVWGETS
jgi:hypothetical protein